MNRKIPVILAVILGMLGLVLIIIWPLAPLWERMGAEPICISGSLPRLRVGPCPPRPGSSAVTPGPLPTVGTTGPIPLIFDDDGSPDGMVALLYFLRNPLFDVEAVTVSSGEAHPEVFARHLLPLLAGLGYSDIPVGAGRETPLQGNNAFPGPWRQASDDFWGISYPEAPTSEGPAPAADLIVETVHRSPQPVMVFVSGTHTNLAEALRLDPGIATNIRDVYVMGGSIQVPGNIKSDWPEIDNAVSEWNIWVDPVAADEVFASGLSIHLAPLDATNRVPWSESDARLWAASGSPAGTLAADLLQVMLDSWSSPSVYLWDLVPAVWATDLALCPKVPLSIDIVVTPGPNQGQTVTTDQPANTTVCLEPDSEPLRALAGGVLSK